MNVQCINESTKADTGAEWLLQLVPVPVVISTYLYSVGNVDS